MVMARWQTTLQDEAGNVIPSAVITVRRELSGFPLAQIKSDRDGVTPKANPFNLVEADDGFIFFHALGGAYRIHALLPGGDEKELRYVAVGTAAETDDAAAAAGQTVTETGSGPFTVADDTTVLILDRASPGSTVVNLGSIDDRAGRDLLIVDVAGNAGDITINPDGGDSGGIMGDASLVLASTAENKARQRLTPDADLDGWLAV